MPKAPTSAPPAVTELVEHFQRNLEQYRSPQYKEAEVRREFIDPFFEALGWDVQNRRKYAEAYKDVVHEPSLDEEGAFSRAPDYSFQPAGHIKFFVEAKKPSVNLDESHPPGGWPTRSPQGSSIVGSGENLEGAPLNAVFVEWAKIVALETCEHSESPPQGFPGSNP